MIEIPLCRRLRQRTDSGHLSDLKAVVCVVKTRSETQVQAEINKRYMEDQRTSINEMSVPFTKSTGVVTKSAASQRPWLNKTTKKGPTITAATDKPAEPD